MSYNYDLYLMEHRGNVDRAWQILQEIVPKNVIPEEQYEAIQYLINFHDHSKNNPEEYIPYDNYFYGNNQSYETKQEFNYAWLTHLHQNPHHWQYWVLVADDKDEPTIAMDMPIPYVIEMICDWWSFSLKNDKPLEIVNWYDDHKDYIILHPKTKELVESIIDIIEANYGGDVVEEANNE